MPTPSSIQVARRRWLILLVAALTLFTTVRQTFHRPGTPFGDLAHLYLGAQCLLHRCNPYDAAALNTEAAAHRESTPPVWPQAPVYPPSSLLVTLPFTVLRWPSAAIAFDLLAGLLFTLAAALVALRLNLAMPPASLLLLATLITNPIIATLEFANPSLPATALAAIAAVWLLHPACKASTLAWLPLGLAFALKPQLILGVVILLFCLLATRRSALKAAAFALMLLLTAALAYRLRLGSFAFLAQLQANLRMALLPGSTSDFSRANPESFDFLNLQTILTRLPHITRAAAEHLAWAITLVLAAIALWAGRNTRRRPWTLLALAILISLMPLYHRGYDRVIALLLVPAAIEIFAAARPLAWLYTAVACLWVANDTLMQHWLRRWHYAVQNPLEELLLCALLLASLRRTPPMHAAEPAAEVGSIAG